MGTVADVQAAAEWVAQALSHSGYRADFTPASLWEVERFFDTQAPGGRPLPNGLLGESTGSRVFAIGSYIGEVIRRGVGGNWVGDDDDPAAEVNVALHLPDRSVIWPIQRAIKRLQNGPEDSIAGYGAAIGLDIGPGPTTRRRLWGRR